MVDKGWDVRSGRVVQAGGWEGLPRESGLLIYRCKTT